MSKEDFKNYVVNDLLRNLPDISVRSMFGGYGIYQGGDFFAVTVGGQLYFKVDDSNRGDYEAAGSHAWTYNDGKRMVTMGYWLLPENILEDSQSVIEWVKKSVLVAQNKKKIKKVSNKTKYGTGKKTSKKS